MQEEKLVGSLPFWYLICIMVGIITLLLADIPAAEIFLALLMGLLIITGLRHMAELLKKSPFRPTGEKLSQKQ